MDVFLFQTATHQNNPHYCKTDNEIRIHRLLRRKNHFREGRFDEIQKQSRNYNE